MSAVFVHDEPGTPAGAWSSHPRWSLLPDVTDRITDRITGQPTEQTPDRIDRLVVVAAHPDDETLGAGGLSALATEAGIPVVVVLATAGEHSHPGSPTTTPDDLARCRLGESEAALREVAPLATMHFLGLDDGDVTGCELRLTTRLVEVVGDGRRTLLVAPWRHDGHPDHEAAGRAAARTARRTGAMLLEYPIWFWHWASPHDAPWADLRAVALPAAAVEAKQGAVARHVTQVAPLSDAPGDEVLLTTEFLAHFARDREVFVERPVADPALDDLHSELADPWGVDTRWYEERKRDLTLAVLPRRRFGQGLEVGCSTGALAAALAERCDRLDAVDSSAVAVARARERLAPTSNVAVHRLEVPHQWPDGVLDLIVVSEVGYFLSPAQLDHMIERIVDCLAPDGVVVLCHWRHEIVGWPLDGAAVHRRFREKLTVPVIAHYIDRDVEILVLARSDVLPDPAA